MRGNLCEVRSVGRDRADLVLGVYRECEDFLGLGSQPRADMPMVLKDLDESQQRGGFFCGVHDAGGRMIGVVDFMPRGYQGRAGVAFLSLLMVVPRLRRRGIGTEVVGLIEHEVGKDPSVTMVYTAVQTNNPNAQRFWLGCGYHVAGGPEARPDGTTVLSMHKDFSRGA